MLAIIKKGSKQYKVEENRSFVIDGWHNIGDIISFNDAYVINEDSLVAGSVTAEVIDNHKTKKVNIIKMKRRKHHIKRQGSRNLVSKVIVKSIAIN